MTPAARSTRARHRARFAGLAGAAAIAVVILGAARPHGEQPAAGPGLRPTAHDPVPAELSSYWLDARGRHRDHAGAARLRARRGGDRRQRRRPLGRPAPPVARARHVDPRRSRALLPRAGGARTGRPRDGRGGVRRRRWRHARARSPSRRWCAWARRTSAAVDYAAAAAAYTRAAGRTCRPTPIASRMPSAWRCERAGDLPGSIAAHRRVYFDYPLSPDAVDVRRGARRGSARSTADFDGRLDARTGTRRRALRRPAVGRWPASPTARVVDLARRRGTDGRRAVRAAACRRAAQAVPTRRRTAAAAGRRRARTRPRRACTCALAAARPGTDGRLRAGGARSRRRRSGRVPYAEEALNALATSLIVRRRRRRRGGRVFGQMVRPVSGRPVRRARRLEGRLVGLSAGRDGRRGAVLRDRRRAAFRARTSVRRGSTGARGRRSSSATATGATARLRAHRHRLPQQLLRAAGAAPAEAGRTPCRRAIVESAGPRPSPPPTAAADRAAAVARPPRPGAGRDAVRAPAVGRLAGAARPRRRWRSTAPDGCGSASTR